MRKTILLALVLLLGIVEMNAQLFEVHPADAAPYVPTSLIENYFLGEGIQIQSIKYFGSEDATGFFQGAEALLGIERGIVISTGKISAIKQAANIEASTVTSTDVITDDELSAIVGNSIVRDISKYEITFIPTADLISFNYVFASEEYPDYVCSQFNDIFGFFITGPNPNGPAFDNTNIAITPNSQNEPVSINTVNNGIIGQNGSEFICQTNGGNLNNSEFYNSNTSDEIVYNGILSKFNASIAVIPCQTYTMKFAIADIRDELLDSAVFLEAKSFTSNDLKVQAITSNSNGIMTEGCQHGQLEFNIETPLAEDLLIAYEVIGNAQNELDYLLSPTTLVIEAGETSEILNIEALEDETVEGIEEIGIVITKNACSKDTLWLAINESNLVPPELPEKIVLCQPEEISLDATIAAQTTEPIIFENNQSQEIFPEREPIISEILVENIFPSSLKASSFAKVCIDELEHPWLEDLDLYLIGPDGQFIELSTDNGEDGGNSVGPDYYRNTCFSLTANGKIYGENPGGASYEMAPFTGDFLPEGSWSDFIGDASFKVNGIWKLMMIDDFATGVGTLKKWSIHFDTNYELSYMWSPSETLSCDDCPKPIAAPTTSTNFELKIEDSNGCAIMENIDVQIGENLQTPFIECDDSVLGQVGFHWEIDPDAVSYSINVNGMGWENIELDSILFLPTPTSDEGKILLELMSIGNCGQSEIASLSCSNEPCGTFGLMLKNEPMITCAGDENATIEVGVEPNNPDLIFSLDNERNQTGVFENKGPGTYMVNATDAEGCIQSIEVVIDSIDPIEVDSKIEPVRCNGQRLGSISIIVSGGRPPYMYNWSNNSTNGGINNLEEGVYTLLLTDQNECTVNLEFIVEKETDLEIESEVIHPSCSTVFNGSITFAPSIMQLDLEANWSDGASEINRTDLKEGIYTVELSDGGGCEYFYEFELIPQYELLSEVAIKGVSCFGDGDGSIALEIKDGVEPYNIEWETGQSGSTIEDLTGGRYTYIATDINGCQTADSILVSSPDRLELLYEEIIEPVCEGFPFVSIDLEAFGGVGGYQFRKDDNSFGESQSYEGLGNGEHIFEVADSNNCMTQVSIPIDHPFKELMLLEVENQFDLILGESTTIEIEVINSEGDLTYEWLSDDALALSCYDCPEPIFEGLKTQEISVLVIDELNCMAEAKILFRLEKAPKIFVPNAFSPNGDGINDQLIVFGKEDTFKKIKSFGIYDRWGNTVYSKTDFQVNQHQGWDGRYRNEPLNPAVFAWKLELEHFDGSIESMGGNLSLIK